MTERDAIEIINEVRINNPFTMGCSLNEFIEGFIERYYKISGELIPKDYISIANKIIETRR